MNPLILLIISNNFTFQRLLCWIRKLYSHQCDTILHHICHQSKYKQSEYIVLSFTSNCTLSKYFSIPTTTLDLDSPPMTSVLSGLPPPQVEATSLPLLFPPPLPTPVAMEPSLDGEGLAVRSIHCWLNHLVDLELYW